MATSGTIKEYSTSITEDVTDYYSKHKYIEFKPDPTLAMKNNLPSVMNRSQLGLMTKSTEYGTDTPVKMALFDENLYNMDTAMYNTSLYFSKMKKEEQELIRSGSTVINETDGLKNVFKPGYLKSVEDFLKSQYYNAYQKEGFSSGSSATEHGNDFSFIDVIATKIKDNIWNYSSTVDVESGTIKEGMDSGLTYKAYSGYVDTQVSDKNYFNDKSLKDSGGKPITGVTSNFDGISKITKNKVTGSTAITMTTLTGYLFTGNKAGVWKFSISSDDMSVLIITDTNGVAESASFGSPQVKLKIENRGLHGMVEKQGEVSLLANRYYKVDITTGNNYGPGDLIFKFSPPGHVTTWTERQRYGDRRFSKKYRTITHTETAWITKADGYFYTSVPQASFVSFDPSALKPYDNSAVLAKLYESAKNAAVSAVSSLTASASVKKPSVFVVANPDVPGGLMTIFPKLSTGHNNITRTGHFNWLDWSKISPKAELSAEWFGYLKANVSGKYYINIYSNRPHISNLWIGDNALVNYTTKNADINNYGSLDSTGMYLKGQQDQMSSEIDVVAGRYYPVRIQYSQAALTMLYNFNVYILKLNGDGSKGKVGNATAYFCSLTDRNNVNYEPIQMAMALRNDKGEKNPALFNCYVSPLNTSNNYINNENIRKSRGQDSKIFQSFILTPKDGLGNGSPKLTLAPNGDLIFNNGISNRSITGSNLDDSKGSVENTNCGKLCSLPEFNTRSKVVVPGTPVMTDIGIYNLSVKENKTGTGEELLGKFVKVTQSNKTLNSVNYTSIYLEVDKTNYELYYSGINNDPKVVSKKDTLDSCYVSYSIGKTGTKETVQLTYDSSKKIFVKTIDNYSSAKAQYDSAQPSSSSPYEKYKKDYQSAMDTDAQNCINTANSGCNFYAGVSNDGEIFITNGMGKSVWGSKNPGKLVEKLGASYSPAIPSPNMLKSVSEWLTDADKLNNYYIYSASYADPFDKTKFLSTSIGKGQKYEVLYSPNGKYKLTLENGTLELKYAVNGDTYEKYYTDNDGSQSFMLHIITADEKIGNVYLANTEDKTMYEMKNDKDKILKYSKTFSKSSASADYQYPPYNSNSSAINSTDYIKSMKSKAECEASCAGSDSCSHYYSYTTKDNKTWCMANTDKSPEQYYNKIPELKSSNLYIRDKMLDSTCSYSENRCNQYKNVSLLTNSSSNTNSTFDGYNKDYDVIYSRELGYGQVEDPTSEGACGVPRIYGRLANLVGPEKNVGEYKFNSAGCTEGFDTLGGNDTAKPVIEGMNVTGYNESNSCKLVNEYSNSIDIDPSKFTSMLDNCRADLLKNVGSIESYWTEFNKDNAKINNYYNEISSGTAAINTKYPVINNEKTVPNSVNYDSIDFSGNLLLSDELKPSTSLKDGRMKDEKENITQEIILYMVSIMALVAVLLFLIFTTSSLY